ncbi:WcbI family polysaccharide biosynthesis putative acetyltransferase [Roseomonas elaeocarpi]|uniref:WcbI family polysaccharide biosynthesis putative acetyltransferase n=1 Tax=Roseomonas elaeocarpi TaxID=907779 RepID=A0ABV6JSH2_9PROT
MSAGTVRPGLQRRGAAGAAPRLLVFGGAQARRMAALMRDLPAPAGQFDVLHLDHAAPEQPDAALATGGAPVLLWEQALDASVGAAATAARDRLRASLPMGTPVVRFPTLGFPSLWPFEGQDPRLNRAGDAAQYAGGIRYPFTDRIAQAVAAAPGAAALPDDALYDLYLERFTPELPRLDRRLAADRARLEWRDRHSDVAVAPFILANFRNRRLFANSRQPSGPLLGEVLRGLLAASADALGLDARAAQNGIDLLTRHRQDDAALEAPINPLVAGHFRLRYGREGERTTQAGTSWTFRDYIVGYMRWRAYAC